MGSPKAQRTHAITKSAARRTPRRHTDTADRWASPKLDADTTKCSARRQRTPRERAGLAEQRDSPRCSRRTHTTFHTNFITSPALNSTSYTSHEHHCETPVRRRREECASNRVALNKSRASDDLPTDTQPHGATVSPKAHCAHDKHEIGRQANSPPAYRHGGSMGLPQAQRGHNTVLDPAPADSPPSHRSSGATGLPAPLTPRHPLSYLHSALASGAPRASCQPTTEAHTWRRQHGQGRTKKFLSTDGLALVCLRLLVRVVLLATVQRRYCAILAESPALIRAMVT